uniref:Ig-like domain-containing protein n=1 Tax=Lygus hesperus TaxID=30085 RepID=A0A0A9XIN8_LYGHE
MVAGRIAKCDSRITGTAPSNQQQHSTASTCGVSTRVDTAVGGAPQSIATLQPTGNSVCSGAGSSTSTCTATAVGPGAKLPWQQQALQFSAVRNTVSATSARSTVLTSRCYYRCTELSCANSGRWVRQGDQQLRNCVQGTVLQHAVERVVLLEKKKQCTFCNSVYIQIYITPTYPLDMQQQDQCYSCHTRSTVAAV